MYDIILLLNRVLEDISKDNQINFDNYDYRFDYERINVVISYLIDNDYIIPMQKDNKKMYSITKRGDRLRLVTKVKN